MRNTAVGLGFVVSVVIAQGAARGETYQVGPGRAFTQLSDVAPQLVAGDIVELDGGATYDAVVLDPSGTEAQPITIRGVGGRPILAGGDFTLRVEGDHWLIEGIEVTGGARVCVFHGGADLTLTDVIVRDCPAHGILGADQGSGSLLLDHIEVYGCGGEPAGEALKHSIYIATDENENPGSVFRMQHSYVHDTNGGNAVKSRAERTEIYYNWIEGAQYYELEMIGPDDGIGTGGLREDADVVGNVLYQRGSQSYVSRFGGDGTGESQGRYRYVNNVFVVSGNSGAMRCFDAAESLELHNNVFVLLGGGSLSYLVRTDDCNWTNGEQIVGSNNWIPSGTGSVPAGLEGTIEGDDPGFTDLQGRDLRPVEGSPLVDRGTSETVRAWSWGVPDPLPVPTYVPPFHSRETPGSSSGREEIGAIDIGAFEHGSALEPPPDAGPGGPGDPDGGGGGGGGDGGGGGSASGEPTMACGCRVGGAASAASSGLIASIALAVLGATRAAARRRRGPRA